MTNNREIDQSIPSISQLNRIGTSLPMQLIAQFDIDKCFVIYN